MAKKPKVVRTVESGVPGIYPAVTIYDEVLNHIETGHPEEFSRIEEVYSTIKSPDAVYRSRTNPKSVLLHNRASTSSSGDPLRVVVKVVSSDEAIMTSTYFAATSIAAPVERSSPRLMTTVSSS